jgi:hypothetical protein
MPPKESARYIVNLLYIAANHDCESSLGRYVLDHLTAGSSGPTISQCRNRFIKQDQPIPVISSIQHKLSEYSQLLSLSNIGGRA